MKIDLIDLNGKFVRTVYNSFQEKGLLTIDEDMNDLANGIYFYTVMFNGEVTTQKIMKL